MQWIHEMRVLVGAGNGETNETNEINEMGVCWNERKGARRANWGKTMKNSAARRVRIWAPQSGPLRCLESVFSEYRNILSYFMVPGIEIAMACQWCNLPRKVTLFTELSIFQMNAHSHIQHPCGRLVHVIHFDSLIFILLPLTHNSPCFQQRSPTNLVRHRSPKKEESATCTIIA